MRLRTQKRRRRECKTDYKLRLNLLKSGVPRIVIRRTNKYFSAQIVESNEGQDKVLAGVISKDLIKEGWDAKFSGSLKSVPAAYLTGLLLAKKAQPKQKYIVDLGMVRTQDGNRAFAVLKGLVDAGLNVNVNEKVFPSDNRITGEHLKDDVKKVISKVKEKLA